MRLRYFGIQTTWYSVLYTLWPDKRFSILPAYQNIGDRIHPRASPWNSAIILDQAQVDLREFKSKKIRPLERHAEKIVAEYNANEIKELLKKPNLIWIDWNYGASHVERREYSGWDDYYGEIFHGSTSQGYDNFLTKTGIFYEKHNKLYEAETIDERKSSYHSETDASYTTSHNTKELDKSPDEIILDAVKLAKSKI